MMKFDRYEWVAIGIMISLFIFVGFIQGWSVSLVILNMCIISAIMTMGVNISWGYAGVINFGVMGFSVANFGRERVAQQPARWQSASPLPASQAAACWAARRMKPSSQPSSGQRQPGRQPTRQAASRPGSQAGN